MTDPFILSENTQVACTDATRPIAQRDPILYAGSAGAKYLLDFLDPYCNPYPDGPLAGGSVLNNLVAGGANATVVGSSFSNVAGLAGVVSSGGGGSIAIGVAGAYDMHAAGDHEFYADMFFKIMPTDASAPYTPMMTLTNNTQGNSVFEFESGSDGKSPRSLVGYGLGFYPINNTQGWGVGAPAHVAVHYKPSIGLVEMYANGSLFGMTSNTPKAIPSASTALALITGAWKGVIYSVYFEDLSLSGGAAATIAATRWTYNSPRFV